MTMTDNELQPDNDVAPDNAWDNRQLILAAMAPRPATRPARRNTMATPDAGVNAPDTDITKKSGGLARALGKAGAAAGRKLNKLIPPEKRSRAALIGIPAIVIALVVLMVALSIVRSLTNDVTPQAAPPPPPSAPSSSLPPLRQDVVLTGIRAKDLCPRDANYSDANNALDGDLNTAWRCTRAKNEDNQVIQFDFGRQVTLTQIRGIGGFAPADQWNHNQIVTVFEIWFPKDLKRDPIPLNTGAVPDYRAAEIDPPATVSQILIRVKETVDPPNPPSQEGQGTDEKVTTVASSEFQFIGVNGPTA